MLGVFSDSAVPERCETPNESSPVTTHTATRNTRASTTDGYLCSQRILGRGSRARFLRCSLRAQVRIHPSDSGVEFRISSVLLPILFLTLRVTSIESCTRGSVMYAINAESANSPATDASSTPALFESSGLFASHGRLL